MLTTPQSDPKFMEKPRRKPTLEEAAAILEAARESVRPYLPKDRNLMEEFYAERRAAAARGE